MRIRVAWTETSSHEEDIEIDDEEWAGCATAGHREALVDDAIAELDYMPGLLNYDREIDSYKEED